MPGALLYIVCMPKSSTKANRSKRSKERILSSQTVYRGPVFWVTTDDVEEPGRGSRATRRHPSHGLGRRAGGSTIRAQSLAFFWRDSTATRRPTICGNCLPGVSILGNRSFTPPSANF